MSEQNSTFILENSCLVKDEYNNCPDLNSIQLDIIKDETPIYQKSDDNNQLYHINDSNTANNITLESFNVDAVEIKTEKDDMYTGTQNSILIVKDNFLVKTEIDIKKEISYLNNVNSIETCDMKDITVNNDKSNNITIDTLNSNIEIKIENDCKNASIQNSILDIEDGYSIKVENDSFLNTNSSLSNSIYEASTSFQNNEDNELSCLNEWVFNKIEQMSPEHCQIFNENIYEVKTEINYKINNFGTSMNDLKSDQKDVEKHNKIQLKHITNCDKKQYECNICQQSFSIQQVLKTHKLTHTGEKSYTCDICQKSFSLKQTIKTHMLIHTGERLYTCVICQQSFLRKQTLKTHMFTHTSVKPYTCVICQKSYTVKQSLKTHMITHTGEKPYTCIICQKSFTVKQSLKTHMFTHTDKKIHKCNICQKLFPVIKFLKRHMITHTGKKLHKCDICQKSFLQKAHLKCHTFTHTGEKLHKCNICQKSFSKKENLKSHIKTHTGEKRHKCNVCQKLFSEKGNLKTHMFTHTGEKPYTCNICQKSFSTQQALKTHIFSHTGEKPYTCGVCKKAFTSNQNLKNHMYTHTGKAT